MPSSTLPTLPTTTTVSQQKALEPAAEGDGCNGDVAATSVPRLAKLFSGKSKEKIDKSSLLAASPLQLPPTPPPTPTLLRPTAPPTPTEAAAVALPTPPPAPAAKIPKNPRKPKTRHPMSLRDFAWSRMDSKHNLLVINTLLRLRGPRPLSAEALAAAVERRLLPRFPRFSQRARAFPLPHWSDNAGFKLSDHISVEERGGGGGGGGGGAEEQEQDDVEKGGSSSSSSLEHRVAKLAAVPLDGRKPLWEMILMSKEEEEEKEDSDTTFLLFRVHHCVTDGIGLMSVLERLTTDEEAEAEEEVGGETAAAAAAATTAQPPPVGQLRSSSSLASRSSSSPPSSPSPLPVFFRTLGNALRLTVAWPHGPYPKNAFRAPAPLSGTKRFAWAPRPLEAERLRAVARARGVTINDMFLAAAAAALRSYFSLGDEEEEEETKKNKWNEKKKKAADRVRAFVTFSVRDEGKTPAALLGNHFGLVAVDLPTHVACPRERLERASARMERLKASREPHGVAALLSLAGLAPGRAVQGFFLREFTKKGSIVLSNVSGPPAGEEKSGTLAGASLEDVVVFVPQTGDLGGSFGLFSFAGKVQLSLAADESLVRDPRRLMGLLEEAFEELEKVTEKDAMMIGVGNGGGAEMREE